MDKKFFINQFNQDSNFLISSLWEDINLSKEIEYPVYTDDFYTSNIFLKLEKFQESLGIEVYSKGISPFSERKLIAFLPKNFPIEEVFFPIKYFMIDGKNKFSKLIHKDFLGAIMALGIKREIMGDLLVKDSICYGIIKDTYFDFLQKNINSIGKVPVKVVETCEESIPKTEYLELTFSVTSLRFDLFISEITNKSRNDAQSFIEKGEVLLNYEPEKKNSKELVPGDIITIRGYGKFIFYKELGENKKGKIKINVKKFI